MDILREQRGRNKHGSVLNTTLFFPMLNYIVERILVHGFAVWLSLWVADIDEEMSQIKYLYFIHKVELLSSTFLALQY